jgi:hypothetical protein
MPMVALALLVTGCASSEPVKSGLVDVYGVIRDREGVGVQGIYVYVDDQCSSPPTDAHGRFRIPARPGRHSFLLDGFNVPFPAVHIDTVVVGPSATRLDYRYGGFKVEGRLAGPGGRAIDGVVNVFGNSPDTDYGIRVRSRLKRGRYVFFIPRGVYYFQTEPTVEYYPATDGGRRPPKIQIDADTTIDLSASGHLVEGRVTLRGQPLSRVTVEVRGVAWADTVETSAVSTTTSKGRYRLFVPNGSYTFFIHREPYLSPFAVRWFRREIRGPERIETNLPMTYWSGVVRDSVTGAPVESVTLWAGDPRDQTYPSSYGAMSMSDRTGRFRMELEPTRTYLLWWSKGNVIPRKFGTAVAGNDSTLEVRVSAR